MVFLRPMGRPRECAPARWPAAPSMPQISARGRAASSYRVERAVAVGMAFDSRSGHLFVAGGPTGFVYLDDTLTGAEVAAFEVTSAETTFVNDGVSPGRPLMH